MCCKVTIEINVFRNSLSQQSSFESILHILIWYIHIYMYHIFIYTCIIYSYIQYIGRILILVFFLNMIDGYNCICNNRNLKILFLLHFSLNRNLTSFAIRLSFLSWFYRVCINCFTLKCSNRNQETKESKGIPISHYKKFFLYNGFYISATQLKFESI